MLNFIGMSLLKQQMSLPLCIECLHQLWDLGKVYSTPISQINTWGWNWILISCSQ